MSQELKKALKDKEMTYGAKATLKRLRTGKVDTVFLASNCPKDVKKEVKNLAGLSDTKVIELNMSNEEVGVLCKKQFFVSVLCY